MTQNKKERRRPRFALRLLLCFLSFTAVIILLLWVFQITLLDSFYKRITIKGIESGAQSIADNLDNENIDNLAARIVRDGTVSIKVIYFSGGTSFEASGSGDSGIFQRLSASELYMLYRTALENGSSYLKTYDRSVTDPLGYDFHDFFGHVPMNDRADGETVVYVNVAQKGNASAVIYTSANLVPVDATVDTLKIQLICLTVILVILSVVLAAVLSRTISKPLVLMNDSARELARGDYSIRFSENGCREVSELGSTLNYAASELGKVDKLKTELIANISHDLRTPLTLISGYTEMMRDIPGENNAENIQLVLDETNRLSALVNDILDLSKLQSGTLTIEPARFCLTDAIEAMLSRYSRMVEQNGYTIEFSPDRRVFVTADELRISQVIYNLVGNAITYTGDDRRVVVRQLCSDGNVTVEVSDSGEGIEPEKLPLIWERYYKVDKSHRRSQCGSGLGLSIVKQILEQHSASFGVRSTKETGSTFWFTLKED